MKKRSDLSADLDDVADRLDEAARLAAGVSWVGPEATSDGNDQVVEDDRGDDDSLGGHSSCALTRYNNQFREPGRLLIMWSVPPE